MRLLIRSFALLCLFTAVALLLTGGAPQYPVGIHPVIEASGRFLLGGVAKGKLLSAKEMAPYVRGGEPYRLYELTKACGETRGSKATRSSEHEYTVEIDPTVPDGTTIVGIDGDWNALPRVPEVVEDTDGRYLGIVRKFLAAQGGEGGRWPPLTG